MMLARASVACMTAATLVACTHPQLDASGVDAQLPMQAGSEAVVRDAPARERAAIVNPELWVLVERADDPFDDRPASASTDCVPAAVMAEDLAGERVLGVDTGSCSYVTTVQLSQREVVSGEVIHVRVWHFELTASEPAQAHVAVVVDGIDVLNERVMIPQPGGLITTQLQVTRAIPAGARVYFHLHNHGANNWALVEVSAGP